MTKEWVLRAAGMALVAMVVAGCAGSPPEAEPQQPVEPPDTTDTTTRPVEPPPPAPPPAFDANGVPLDPDTGQPLKMVFYFDYDRAVLSPGDLGILEKHARVLRDNSDKRLVVEGHCDERGTREYNLALGERRADSVTRFLESAGVNSGRMENVSYGEERPEDAGHTESAWSRNRRAVLSYR